MNKNLLLLLAIILLYTVIIYALIKDFKQLPSPIYGGDYYHQLGGVYNIMYNSIGKWINGLIPGSNVVYLPVYPALVGIFGWLLSLTPMNSMLYFNMLLPTLALSATYLLFLRVFKDEKASLIGVMLLLPITAFPILKYTDFTMHLVIPVFILSLFLFFEIQTIKRAVFLGLSYGVLSLSHGTGFIIGSFLVFAAGFFIVLVKLHQNSYKIDKEVTNLAILAALPFILGFLIAQLYWYKAIFVFYGKMLSRQMEWNVTNFSDFTYQIIFLFDKLFNYFLSISSLWKIMASLLSIAGLLAILANTKTISGAIRKDSSEQIKTGLTGNTYLFLVVLLACAAIITFSYFITQPLLGTNFVPSYMDLLILRPAIAMLAVAGYMYAAEKANTIKKYIFYVILAIFIINSIMSYSDWYNDKWKAVGRNPIPEKIQSLQTFLVNNTNIDDVILTSNELGFMVNAISGRKVIATRRAHSDPFFDFDKYQLIAAKILYGNDTTERSKLLKENKVKYVLYDSDWVGTEWYFDNEGKINGWFDPLLLFETSENKNELNKYNISYYTTKTWVDPALKGPEYKQLDVLIIGPENYYYSPETGIWKQELYNHLTPVWTYSGNGELSILYEVVS